MEIVTLNQILVKFVITTKNNYLTKSELRLCAASNTDCAVSEVNNDGNLRQWPWIEILVYILSSVNHSTEITIISPNEYCLKLAQHGVAIVS